MNKQKTDWENQIRRLNITLPNKTYEWLRTVAFSKHSSISREIREMVEYTKSISYWGALEVNKMKNDK